MKIAMIFFSLNVPGGSASVFLSLASELQNQGHTVDIYCYYFDPDNCFPELSKDLTIIPTKTINTHQLNNSSVVIKLGEGINYYLNAKKIYKKMKGKNYDVIFASEASAYIPALLYKSKHDVPVVWSVFDPISLVDRDRPGMLINKHRWFEYLLKIHNHFDTKNIQRLDAVLVPTHKMKQQLDSFYDINCTVFPLAGIREEDVKVSHVSLVYERLKNKFSFKKTNEKILYSHGHFLPHRRYEDNINAIRKLINRKLPIKYIISGSDKFDPSYFRFIKKLIKDLSLEQVIILDTEFKSNKEVIGYYQYSDIFLFVSIEQTWGLAPFEAMACRKPIVISKGVGCHEVLKDGVNALIVDEKSPDQIAFAVQRLLENKKLYADISTNGYDSTLSEFTYSTITKKVTAYLGDIINNKV